MNNPKPTMPMPHAVDVGLIVICTGRYIRFLPDLLQGAREHVVGLSHVYVLSDARPDPADDVVWLPWGHVAWPFPTLMRYRAITAYARELSTEGVLLYTDVDMRFQALVDVTDVQGLVAVQHPGFATALPTAFPYERRVESRSAIPAGEGVRYLAGGVQGGRAAVFLDACAAMADWIQDDVSRGILPEWHDESIWNKYCFVNEPDRVLDARFCSPEHQQRPDAIIVALDKNHDELRETPRRDRIERALRSLQKRARNRAVRTLRNLAR